MGQMDRDYWRNRYNRRTIGSVDPDHWRQDEMGDLNRWTPSRRPRKVSDVQVPAGGQLKLFLFALLLALALLLAKSWLERRHLARNVLASPKTELLPQHQPVLHPQQSEQQMSEKKAALDRREELRKAAQRQQREEAEYMRRKEAAWERSYKPSASCAQSATVECGNEYIRARRAFDASYKG